jgi:hypothetical protein
VRPASTATGYGSLSSRFSGLFSRPDASRISLLSDTITIIGAVATGAWAAYTVIVQHEDKLKAEIKADIKEFKQELKVQLENTDKRFKDDLRRQAQAAMNTDKRFREELENTDKRFREQLENTDKRFKDDLRRQAQAAMNPPCAHLIFSDQRQLEEVLNDPKYAPLARDAVPVDPPPRPPRRFHGKKG